MIYEKKHHEDDFDQEINHTHPNESDEEEKEETEKEIERFEELEEEIVGKDGHGQRGQTEGLFVIGESGGFD